jgi:hypothetical protein
LKKATVFIKGGFGNQLFQFSFAEYLKQNNYLVDINTTLLKLPGQHTPRNLTLPISYFGFKEQNFLNKKKFEIFLKVNSSSKINNSFFGQYFDKFKYTKENSNFTEYNNKHLYFNGYWKDMTYVQNNKDYIKSSLSKNEIIKSKLHSTPKENTVMIHVRRRDFVKLGWDLKIEYYKKSINLLEKKFKDINIDIFTDDEEWVRNQKIFSRANNIFPQMYTLGSGEDNTEETIYTFSQMLSYQNFIVSNSSFAFWAAFLRCNEDSFITVPKPWFVNNNHPTLTMENWIVVDNNY